MVSRGWDGHQGWEQADRSTLAMVLSISTPHHQRPFAPLRVTLEPNLVMLSAAKHLDTHHERPSLRSG